MVEAIKTHKNSVATQPTIENEAFWHRHIQSFKTSGLTRTKYCQLHKVNYDRFGYWLRKLVPCSASLVPVKVKANNEPLLRQTAICILNLRNGANLAIHDLQVLSFVLEKMV
jgi:hypothetical protein